MNGKIATFAFLLIFNSLWSAEASSPVVLWTLKRIGGGHVESNLNEFSSTQFADLVAWKSEHGSIPVIAFGLNSLSLEDLTSQGGIGTVEPFSKLKRIADASAETLLFPAVKSAADSISILQSKGFEVQQINAGDPLPKIANPSTILVIMDKSSVNMDDEILRVFSKYTLDYPNLVGMLWGKQSTWSEEPEEETNNDILRRKKRQVEKSDLFVYTDEKMVFLVFREVVLTLYNPKKTVSFTNATGTTDTSKPTHVILNLSFPKTTEGVKTESFELSMNLTKGNLGYWTLFSSEVTLTADSIKWVNAPLSSSMDLTVPTHFSYHCSKFASLYPKPTEAQNKTSFTIDIIGFQIQAFMNGKVEKFLPEYDCVGFFTPGIWMGIVVTIMLLSILTWGLKMLMDVKTMDRFDDPKGKPISFGSGE